MTRKAGMVRLSPHKALVIAHSIRLFLDFFQLWMVLGSVGGTGGTLIYTFLDGTLFELTLLYTSRVLHRLKLVDSSRIFTVDQLGFLTVLFRP
jgi:hypothetical protein